MDAKRQQQSTNLEDLPGERWHYVEGYEGRYSVSNMGRVKSLERLSAPRSDNGARCRIRERILSQSTVGGSPRVSLTLDGVSKELYVARLVALAWVPGRSEVSRVVIHKNRDREDCRAANLVWCSYRAAFDRSNADREWPRGEDVPGHVLEESDIPAICAARDAGARISEIARDYDVSPHCIRQVLSRGSWSHIERDPRELGSYDRPRDWAPAAKICERDVLDIRQRHREGESYAAIARDYPVSDATVAHIVRRYTWRWVK